MSEQFNNHEQHRRTRRARRMIGLVGAAVLSLASSITHAVPIASTGDLGNNIINDAGNYLWLPVLSSPSMVAPATLDVKYGLWNSPDVSIDVLVNGSLIGSILADQGYVSPGPKFGSLDVTGLLIDGVNTVLFTGNSANTGDYVIGQVDISYDSSSAPVPEPGMLGLLFIGLLVLGAARRAQPYTG